MLKKAYINFKKERERKGKDFINRHEYKIISIFIISFAF